MYVLKISIKSHWVSLFPELTIYSAVTYVDKLSKLTVSLTETCFLFRNCLWIFCRLSSFSYSCTSFSCTPSYARFVSVIWISSVYVSTVLVIQCFYVVVVPFGKMSTCFLCLEPQGTPPMKKPRKMTAMWFAVMKHGHLFCAC